jgi:hypothetical protein
LREQTPRWGPCQTNLHWILVAPDKVPDGVNAHFVHQSKFKSLVICDYAQQGCQWQEQRTLHIAPLNLKSSTTTTTRTLPLKPPPTTTTRKSWEQQSESIQHGKERELNDFVVSKCSGGTPWKTNVTTLK